MKNLYFILLDSCIESNDILCNKHSKAIIVNYYYRCNFWVRNIDNWGETVIIILAKFALKDEIMMISEAKKLYNCICYANIKEIK